MTEVHYYSGDGLWEAKDTARKAGNFYAEGWGRTVEKALENMEKNFKRYQDLQNWSDYSI